MAVLIKGLQMPKNCYECRLWDTADSGRTFCVAHLNYIEDPRSGRLDTCPLVKLPDHGDLVDRDALIEEAKILGTVTCHQPFDFPYGCNLVEWCKAAETVIPAERSEDD